MCLIKIAAADVYIRVIQTVIKEKCGKIDVRIIVLLLVSNEMCSELKRSTVKKHSLLLFTSQCIQRVLLFGFI